MLTSTVPYNKKAVKRIIKHYQDLRSSDPMAFYQVVKEYRDMADGGDGGPLGFEPRDWPEYAVTAMLPVDAPPSVRAYSYPGYPDRYFLEVLRALDEE